jgi:hypothetical protein
MIEPESTSQVLKRLADQGYTEDFCTDKDGLKILPHNIVVDPDQIVVDKIYRFEGETDLDDEEIIFALSYPKLGLKGTFLVAFGPKMDTLDANIVLRLKKRFGLKK